MKIVHFFPHSANRAFLRSFAKYLSDNHKQIYECYKNTTAFCDVLNKRLDETDIVIVTAHGSTDCIFGDEIRGLPQVMGLHDLGCLKNSFVFSFSCSTSSLGKDVCDIHNALAYIGFKDDIDLVVVSGDNAYKSELGKILQDIYFEVLSESFNTFIRRNLTVKDFVKLIQRNLETCHSRVTEMTTTELAQKYSLSQKMILDPRFIHKLKFNMLTTINEVQNMIEFHGEGAFIPWAFIVDDNPLYLTKLLNKVEKEIFSERNEYYKYFLLAILYAKLGEDGLAAESLALSQALYSQYRPIIRLIAEGFPASLCSNKKHA